MIGLKKTSGYVWGLAWGLGLALLYALPHGGLQIHSTAEGFWIWGNACSIAGILLFLLAGCLWLDRSGIWDWLLYALYQARYLLMREKAESYTNFHSFRQLRERSKVPVPQVLMIGAIWLAAGYLLSIQYYNI